MHNIRYFVMDVDGTLTDGKVYMGENGEVMKAFDIKDGYGIHDMLIPAGMEPVIITGRKSNIVLNRCKELGIKEVYQGVSDKLKRLKEVIPDFAQVAYIGDDLNDLPCMKSIKVAGGIIGCPENAVSEVKELADYVAGHDGGNGAVREMIEWILKNS